MFPVHKKKQPPIFALPPFSPLLFFFFSLMCKKRNRKGTHTHRGISVTSLPLYSLVQAPKESRSFRQNLDSLTVAYWHVAL